MKKLSGLCAGLCVLFSGSVLLAQDVSGAVMPPPKVLVIEREFVKPGKGGALHEKSESAFVNAFAAAKWPTHYLAAESMSGKPRVVFMAGYPSFEAWEKDNHAIEKNAALAATLDRLMVSDGELLTDFDQGVFVFDPDASLRYGDVVHSRYFEVSAYKIKPGHRSDWMELVKLYHDGFEKASATANWALYESYYGADNGGLYLAISKMTSLAEDDASMGDDKKVADAIGPEGMKKVRELSAACIDSEQTNLYAFNPKMSYPADEWIKADPFWKPKPAMDAMPGMAAKKPAAPANP
jgi:hypothetical protein